MKKDKKIRLTVVAILLALNLYVHLGDPLFLRSLLGHFADAYLVDIILPCYLYLLATVAISDFAKWKTAKMPRIIAAMVIFMIGLVVEISQYLDLNIFGNTFDPVDILMYLLGIVIGIGIDWIIMIFFKSD